MAYQPMTGVRCTHAVDLADRIDLFELIGNERVLELSHQGRGPGFATEATVAKSTGVEQRRILRPGVKPIDLAVEVIDRLAEEFGLDIHDCPWIGLCHSNTDPAAADRLADKLSRVVGLPRERVANINFGCVGYLELLRRGAGQLAELPEGTRVPLLTVETPEDWHDATDRAFCGIISAGATGTILQRDAGHKLRYINVEHIPVSDEIRNHQPFFWVEEGEFLRFSGDTSQRRVMRMNGEAVFLSGVNLMIEACRTAFNAVSPTDQRIIVVPHQPSGKMLRAMIAVLRDELPCAEIINNLALYGNSISSSIPTVLARINDVLVDQGSDRLSEGDLLLLPAAGICMETRADHLTQGWAVIEW
ncbi:3-oxoacyl-[acyl-carrier-protein] synthase 3 [Maioricimonas rarisocia]|uniref:3-oxoacyl-[acyl-carrier-protein] synthase 3 n=1 Tax=Maioricimonas rarisocia TaxID=2528026 RepID=A0A517ZC31_9PLAN|nr:3-oxoacyl-[acyl-carrier-protein] synthase III C-terminal domain-containing protein [Maioricimonas rarisocia]QDU40038.1 3-oxoacyl-[acyl-carrier-protein] synthase 3 [Maioricimonas rarisocia]